MHPQLNKAIADYAKEKLTDKKPYQRMVDYLVSYVIKHKEDYPSLELERSNIMAALQAAFDLEMEEAVVREVNAFYSFMEAKGLYELAESYLEHAYKSALSLDNKKGLVHCLHLWVKLSITVDITLRQKIISKKA